MSFRCWKGRRGLFKYLTCCLNSDKAVSQEMSRGKFQSRAVLGTENVTVHAILNNIEKEDQVVCAAPEENEGEDSRQPGIIVEDLECTDDEVTDLESINGECGTMETVMEAETREASGTMGPATKEEAQAPETEKGEQHQPGPWKNVEPPPPPWEQPPHPETPSEPSPGALFWSAPGTGDPTAVACRPVPYFKAWEEQVHIVRPKAGRQHRLVPLAICAPHFDLWNAQEVVCAAPEENKGDDLRQPGIIVEDLECRNDEVANVESISDEEEWAICTAAEEQEADDSRGPSIVTEVHNPSIKLGGGDCGTTIGDDDHSGSQEDIKTLKLVICYLKKKNDALNEKVKQMEVKLQSAKNFSDYQKKKHEEENKQLEEMASLMKAQLVALADYNTHIEEEFQKVYCEIKTLEVADMLITGERQFLEKIHYLKMVLQEKMNTLEAAGEQTSHLEKKNQNYRNRAINGSECLGELEDTIEAYPEEI